MPTGSWFTSHCGLPGGLADPGVAAQRRQTPCAVASSASRRRDHPAAPVTRAPATSAARPDRHLGRATSVGRVPGTVAEPPRMSEAASPVGPRRAHRRVGRRSDPRGHRTTTRCGPDRNSDCASSRMTSRPAPTRCPVRRSYSNSSTSSTRSTPSTASSSWAIVGRVEVGVEQPAGAVGAAGQRVDVAGERRRWRAAAPAPAAGRPARAPARRPRPPGSTAFRPRPRCRRGGARRGGRRSGRSSGAESAKSSSWWARGSVRTCGTTSSRTGPLAVGDGQAAGPGDLDRRLERQPLEVAGGHRPLPGAQGERSADLRLARPSRRRRRRWPAAG